MPWDPFAQQRMSALYQALSNHVVAGPGSPHLLRDDPALRSVNATPVGLNYGVRDLNSGIRNSPGYTQQRYIDAVVNGVATSTAAFPSDTNYLAFFAFTDGSAGVPADQQIINRLAPLYNQPNQAKLDFFVENLSDNGPVPAPNGFGTGSNLADWVSLGGETMMQALDSWVQHAPDRESQLASHNPATGIELAYNTYGTRFFELYVTDLDAAANGQVDATGHPLLDDLRYWNSLLTAADLTGDFNSNGVVDAADYVVWRANLGAGYSQADYNTWRSNFAATGSGLALTNSIAGVPEPKTLGLLSVVLIACSWRTTGRFAMDR